MVIICKFFNQFLKHKTTIIILILSFLFSQFFVYFIYTLDPLKVDKNSVFNLPLGLIFLPSLIVIFVLSPLFFKYLTAFPYLRQMLKFNENFKFNLKINFIKMLYFYLFSLICFLLNWILIYSIYLNKLEIKFFFSFLALSVFLLFFLTNFSIFLHKLNLGIKTNLFVFVFLILFFFSFYSPSTIMAYYDPKSSNNKFPNYLFLSKFFLPFYYALLDSKPDSQIELFLGDQKKLLILFLSICSTGVLLSLFSLFSNNGFIKYFK